MRLPWVSREAYDERGRTLEWLRAQLEARVVSEAPDAPTAPAVPAEPIVIPPQAPDPVARVIREQAFLDGREDLQLAAHLRNYAHQLKREGLTADEIVGKLVAWQSTETESAYDKV